MSDGARHLARPIESHTLTKPSACIVGLHCVVIGLSARRTSAVLLCNVVNEDKFAFTMALFHASPRRRRHIDSHPHHALSSELLQGSTVVGADAFVATLRQCPRQLLEKNECTTLVSAQHMT